MKKLMILAAALGALTALPATAQFQKPEDAVKYRKAAFTLMGNHMARVGAMAQGRVPFDGTAAAASADVVAVLSKLPFAAFPEGTGGTDKGAPNAKIWSEKAKFEAASKKMQDEVSKLATAAKANNLDQLKTAFGAAAGTCKACHDDFRNQ